MQFQSAEFQNREEINGGHITPSQLSIWLLARSVARCGGHIVFALTAALIVVARLCRVIRNNIGKRAVFIAAFSFEASFVLLVSFDKPVVHGH